MEEIKVNSKKKKSSKGKIVLCAVGIFLASVFLFGASFILSLGYLINPSPIVFGGGKDANLEKENQELKDEIETLENQIDRLEASVERYKNSYTAPADSETEDASDASENNASDSSSSSTSGQSLHSQKAEEAKKSDNTSSKFEAETTVTPKDDTELSKPASEDITVVEIQ